MVKKLTGKQKLFIKEYLIDRNGTQAAIRAGYSKKTAQQMADENLSKPVIANELKKATEVRNKRLEITQDQVLKELIKDRKNARKAKQYSVAVKVGELLGKHLGMFTDKIDITSKERKIITFAEMVEEDKKNDKKR